MIYTVIYDDLVVAIFKAEDKKEAEKRVLAECLEEEVAPAEEAEALSEFLIQEFEGDLDTGIFQ